MKRNSNIIKLVCENCGKEAQSNKKLSNKNWTVIDNKPCEYCGGKLKITITQLTNQPNTKVNKKAR